jgi:hypothetical protein
LTLTEISYSLSRAGQINYLLFFILEREKNIAQKNNMATTAGEFIHLQFFIKEKKII